MLQAKNLDAFFKQVKDWSAQQKVVVGEVGRGLSAYAFNHLPPISAQYSGDFAANWKYKVGSVDPNFTENVLPDIAKVGRHSGGLSDSAVAHYTSARIKGHPDAINYAYSANAGKEGEFTFGSTAYISNSANHDEHYAWKIENGSIKFRPGNIGHPVAYTVLKMSARFSGQLSPFNIEALRKMRIGTGV
jgi:hypothetical protein